MTEQPSPEPEPAGGWEPPAPAADDPYRFGPPGPNPFGYPTAPPGDAGQQPPPPGQPPFGPYGAPMPPAGYPGAFYPPPGAQYPPPGAPYGSIYQDDPARKNLRRATTGMWLGIASLPLVIISWLDLALIIPAMVMSARALAASKRGAPGRGQAITGLVCSIVALVIVIVLIVVVVVLALRNYGPCNDKYGTSGTDFERCLLTGN